MINLQQNRISQNILFNIKNRTYIRTEKVIVYVPGFIPVNRINNIVKKPKNTVLVVLG